MKTAKEFRDMARKALQGKWLSAAGVTFVASILGASVNMSIVKTGGGVSRGASDSMDSAPMIEVDAETAKKLLGVFAVLAVIGIIYTIVAYIIGSVVSLGLIRYNLDLMDGKSVRIGQLFSEKSMWGKAVRLRIRIAIFTALWTLLFIIPGIIKGYAYSMSGFIMEENPDISPKEAIELSQEMMKGNKWRYFCLQLSFIGWIILGICTCGIGMIWLAPYVNAATTAFYKEVSSAN